MFIGDPDGMYLLKAVPDGTRTFQPQPFVKGSRQQLDKLAAKMIKDYKNVYGVQNEWEYWRDHVAPKSDDADEHCRDVPLNIPFQQELFSGSPVDPTRLVAHIVPVFLYAECLYCRYIAPIVPQPREDEQAVIETTNSVQWSNRGNPCKSMPAYICLFLTVSLHEFVAVCLTMSVCMSMFINVFLYTGMYLSLCLSVPVFIVAHLVIIYM